jgi:P4 family phage/plasmid primase-like protien
MNMHDPNGPMLSAALEYAAMGCEVFPAPPGEKKSYKAEKYSGAKWGKTNDPKIIRQDFRKWPNANVAIVTGVTSGIFVIEADTTEGHGVDGLASISELEVEHGTFPVTRMAISPSGSIHRYYRHPGAGIKIWNSDSLIAPGVDIRGDGGMVIAPPSIKPGVGAYKWLNDEPVADAPEWLIEAASKTKQQKSNEQAASDAFEDCGTDTDLEADPDLIAAALEYIPNADVSWEEWNRLAMAAWRAAKGSFVAFAAFDQWSRKSSKYDAKDTWTKWNALFKCPPINIGAGTIFKLASDNGWIKPRSAADQSVQAEASEPAHPGVGHNSKGKLPLHIVIADIYIAGMKRGFGQLLRRVPDLKGVDHIYRYRDGLWSLQADKDVARSLHPQLQQIVNDLGRESKSKVSTFNEATAHILRSAEVCNHEPVTFDAHGKVPTRDGLIDPITRQMDAFKPEHFATWCLPIPYDANAVCPHWEQLLNDAFADMVDGDRKITVDLVQELVGAALIDDKPKSLSRALVLFGFPDTGKTVVLKVITALFGGAITTTFAKLEGNHGLQSFARRLPWVLGEAFNQSGWYVSDLVKCIITGDPVEINPKNAPAISMKVNTPAFWGTNHPPKFKESSGSMATRMIIIPMTRTFCKETPVGVAEEARKHNPAWEPHDLVINTELPGVLNWALIGLQRALQRGHFVNTESGKDLLEKSRKDSNCAAAFVDECLDADAEAMMSTTDVYSTFKRWWIGEHGEKSTVPSPTTFGHDLANLPNSRIAQDKNKFKNKSSQRFYLGCKLNEAGIGYWQDAANIACISGTKDHRLAETVEKTMRDISPTWKATEEYRRIVPNIQRFVEEQKKRERKEREQQQQATSSDGADKEFPWA